MMIQTLIFSASILAALSTQASVTGDNISVDSINQKLPKGTYFYASRVDGFSDPYVTYQLDASSMKCVALQFKELNLVREMKLSYIEEVFKSNPQIILSFVKDPRNPLGSSSMAENQLSIRFSKAFDGKCSILSSEKIKQTIEKYYVEVLTPKKDLLKQRDITKSLSDNAKKDLSQDDKSRGAAVKKGSEDTKAKQVKKDKAV